MHGVVVTTENNHTIETVWQASNMPEKKLKGGKTKRRKLETGGKGKCN